MPPSAPDGALMPGQAVNTIRTDGSGWWSLNGIVLIRAIPDSNPFDVGNFVVLPGSHTPFWRTIAEVSRAVSLDWGTPYTEGIPDRDDLEFDDALVRYASDLGGGVYDALEWRVVATPGQEVPMAVHVVLDRPQAVVAPRRRMRIEQSQVAS